MEKLTTWILTDGLRVIGILLAAWVATRVLKIVLSRVVRRALQKGLDGLRAKKVAVELDEDRLKTLERVFRSILKTLIWVFAIVTVLPEFGVNIGPLLAGLGFAGLALGFGARTLIQDYISGLFILIEDQYRVGEEVELAGVKGTVKSLNLRRTMIEDGNKNLNFIPNNQIKKATNFSRKIKQKKAVRAKGRKK